MAVLTIRNVPDNVHRALKARAARNQRSTEAEVRALLASSVEPIPAGLGTRLSTIGSTHAVSPDDVDALDAAIAAVEEPAAPHEFE